MICVCARSGAGWKPVCNKPIKPKDAAKNERVERLWEHAKHITKHMMGSYLSHTLHAFEHSATAYLADTEVFPPLSGRPPVALYDRQLFHRFVHQHQHVEAHALELGRE